MQKIKKIAVIGLKGLPALGGTSTVGENIINELKEKYSFTVYAISSHTDRSKTPEGINQIILRKFPIKKLNIFYYYLMSALHAVFKGNYDLIHLHLIDGAYILPILKIRYKVLSTSHGRPQATMKWSEFINIFFRINERIFLKYSDIVTSVSLPLLDEYKEINPRTVLYIPNGIKALPPEAIPAKQEDECILFSARRIIELKGCHLLFEALILSNFKGPVKIIGDLEQVPAYKKRILKLAQKLNVDFVGLITDKKLLMQYIRDSKLFIFPSLKEAMSIMLLEAASVKARLICSDIPENTAVFGDNEVLYFKSSDSADLAEKIQWALNNIEIMDQKSNQAFESLHSEYTWDKIAAKYDTVYKQILQC